MTYQLGWIVAAGVSVLAALLAVPKGLWSRWHERIVDRLDDSVRRRTTRFGRRYREHLLGSLRFIDLKGLATIGFYTPELDEVFVDVSLVHRPPHLVQSDVLSQVPHDVTGRHSLDDFLSHDQPVTLAVLGGPGSGKTTLLRHTAQKICRRRNAGKVPILLYLRDHVTAIVDTPATTLPDLVRGTLGTYSADEPPGWFEQQLREGRCLILLDGLDEVAGEEDRRRLSNWVEQQTKQFPQNDFVITSRPHGYRSTPVTGAVVLQVRSFTEEQISRFVRGWYLAMERHSTGMSTDEIRTRAESASNDLLTRLKDAPALEDLTINPLLLTMIANVHKYRGALPGSRSDLYGEICQVMLWRRAEAKDMPTHLNGDKKESLLRGLAFTMMQQRVRDLPRDDILREFNTALRRISTELTEEDFLADATSNGLLIERESGLFSFAHLTFQEYLASAHIRDKGCPDVLAAAVDDIWWRETTLLYAAKSDADPVVKACLVSASVPALMLAFDCVEQGSALAPELRDELERILHAKEPTPELVRARAGVLVARHARSHVRTTSGGRLCARPVTNALYELFVADNPEHWLQQSSGGGDQPVIGVHHSAAVAFVQWVNTVTDGDPGYRLPYAAEISDEPVRRSLPEEASIWTASRRRPEIAELWTPPGAAEPYTMSHDTLLRYVATDLSDMPGTVDKLRLIRAKVILIVLRMAFALGGQSVPRKLTSLGNRTDARLMTRTATGDALGLKSPAMLDEVHLEQTLRRGMGSVLALCLRSAEMHIRSREPAQSLEEPTEALERVFASARDRARDRASDLDALIDTACKPFMGRTLSRSLTRARLGYGVGPALPERLAEALLQEAGLVTPFVQSSPDAVRRVRPPTDARWAGQWARTTMRELVKDMDRGRFVPTENDPARIRLFALCLAGEAPLDIPAPLREWLRNLVAGVTLLERRATGQAQATEAIMLAIA